MTKDHIYEILREQISERIKLPEKKKLSKEEFRRQMLAKEFQLDEEASIIRYFMEKFQKHGHASPVDMEKFYVAKALQSLSQIQDPENQGILEDVIDSHSNSTKH